MKVEEKKYVKALKNIVELGDMLINNKEYNADAPTQCIVEDMCETANLVLDEYEKKVAKETEQKKNDDEKLPKDYNLKLKKSIPELKNTEYVLYFKNHEVNTECFEFDEKGGKFYYICNDYSFSVEYDSPNLVGWMYLDELIGMFENIKDSN